MRDTWCCWRSPRRSPTRWPRCCAGSVPGRRPRAEDRSEAPAVAADAVEETDRRGSAYGAVLRLEGGVRGVLPGVPDAPAHAGGARERRERALEDLGTQAPVGHRSPAVQRHLERAAAV